MIKNEYTRSKLNEVLYAKNYKTFYSGRPSDINQSAFKLKDWDRLLKEQLSICSKKYKKDIIKFDNITQYKVGEAYRFKKSSRHCTHNKNVLALWGTSYRIISRADDNFLLLLGGYTNIYIKSSIKPSVVEITNLDDLKDVIQTILTYRCETCLHGLETKKHNLRYKKKQKLYESAIRGKYESHLKLAEKLGFEVTLTKNPNWWWDGENAFASVAYNIEDDICLYEHTITSDSIKSLENFTNFDLHELKRILDMDESYQKVCEDDDSLSDKQHDMINTIINDANRITNQSIQKRRNNGKERKA